MMARQTTLQVVPYSDRNARRWYPVRVARVQVQRKRLHIQLVHVSESQDGREQLLILPRPIHPGGLAANFFAACGMVVRAGASINPADCVGQIISVRVAPSRDGGWSVVAIRPMDKEHEHEPAAVAQPEPGYGSAGHADSATP